MIKRPRIALLVLFVSLAVLFACGVGDEAAPVAAVFADDAINDAPEEPAGPETPNPDESDDTEENIPGEEDALIPPEIDYQAVKPNESGNIMIIMYHGLTDNPSASYDRTADAFLNDLNTLYERGYRLISINDLIDGRIATQAGRTPVALTFDDGRPSAFSLSERDGAFELTPGCMADILTRFCGEYPDFGKAAAFYIIGDRDSFSGAGTVADRFNFLLDLGFELGNHTWTHSELNAMDAGQIQAEIGRADRLIRDNTGYIPRSITYPYGIRPTAELRGYALEGEYEGAAYAYAWGIREGQSTVSANPFHVAFDPSNVPRVRASDDSGPDGDVQDLWFFMRYYDEHPERRYISDGLPERVSVPAHLADLINADALNGRELFTYEPETEAGN